MKQKRYIVVDLETTGNQASREDRIIQFAACFVESGKRLETYTTFLNPEKPIPAFIQELTGISPKDVKNAPLFEDVAPIIANLLEDTIFVAHNVSFDWTFLEREMTRAGISLGKMKKLDTVELARIMYPGIDSYKLQDLSDEFNLGHDKPHRADSDAEVTADLLLLLLEKLENLPLPVIRQMTTISGSLKSYLPELLFEIEMRKERENKPLDPAFVEHRGLVIRKKEVEKPTYSRADLLEFPETDEAKMALFKKAGAPLYARSGQFEMMNLVFQAMKSGKHALIEAGTGIGKSLGYFLPAIYQAKQAELPVVISTYTNLLQAQLFEKDVPLLTKLTGFKVKASLLKGRDHYLNLFKFEQLLQEVDTQYDVVVTKLKLLVWLTETTTGDIDEVNLFSGGELFWNRMKHTGWFLSEKHDPWLAHDFYKFNIKQAKNADLVIVNHALLLNDHFSGRETLPKYAFAVIDEAHHFADSARMQGSFVLSYRKIKYFLNQLGSLEKYSLLTRLAMAFPEADSLYDLDIAAMKLSDAVEEFFGLLKMQLNFARKNLQEVVLVENSEKDAWNDKVYYAAEKVLHLLKESEKNMETLLEQGKQEENELGEAESAFLEEMYAFLLDWKNMVKQLEQMLHKKSPILTIYLQADKNHSISSIRLKAVLMEVEPTLGKEFFAKKESVIMTSATLTVKGKFDYLRKSLGLEEEQIMEKRIPSPFDYKENARVMIPDDMPPIKDTPIERYTLELAKYIRHIAVKTNGRMLVLFTASDMLQKTYYHMKNEKSLEEYVLLAQGVSAGSAARLTKQFQMFDKSILLGTTSFWEGIDIPGEDLSCLVIVRLPFAPMDDPYTKAQISLRKERGENAFQTYSLPEAVLRFKQGFGRLIRRESDRGIVFVFDNRVDTTKFGKAFLESIPSAPILKGKQADLLEEVSEFFKEG
ncbi:ATP-dependent helicase DinG [Listeria monocytogenes]|nr:ATP-dependent helicase DinG [Listeria monocytogenes]EGO3809601.1 ATP-dependent DNA helicase DinG [Listeria monocytogenes]